MYDKFFGSFLLNKNVLCNDDLKEILSHMQDTRIKIGTIAMKEGLMKGSKVEEVFQLQKSTDKRFGEIAVDKGYLTEKQVEELLKFQSEESNLKLGQAAVDLGYLNYEQLEQELRNFENDSGLSNIQLRILEEGDTDKIIKEFIDFEESQNSAIYYDYVSLFLRNIIRFLDQQPWIDIKVTENLDNKITACQYMVNNNKIFTGVSISPDNIMEVAGAFSKLEMEEDMELAESALMELLNLHNGIFTVNMSDQGYEYVMDPPEITRDNPLNNMKSGHQIGINTGIGKINLVLSPF